MNPVGIGPNSPKMVAALSKLKWLVVVENVETETASFWKAPKEYGGAEASKIQTEVYLLPAANFAEKDGSFTNSGRWAQWKWKAVDPPGQAKTDQEILARLVLAVKDLYKKEGGACPGAGPERLVDLHEPRQPGPRRGPEGGQRQGARRHRRSEGQDEGPEDRRPAARRLRPAPGRRLDARAATGSTAACYTEAGNNDAAAQQRRSARPRDVPPVGLLVAREPARHVQPRLGRRGRRTPGTRPAPASSGTARSGSATSRT